jgi:hypothetical protein
LKIAKDQRLKTKDISCQMPEARSQKLGSLLAAKKFAIVA